MKEVLVIEDDKETKEYISMVLKSAWPDAEIESTSFGEEGIQLARDKSPEIVILDLGLPDINGLQVLKKLRTFSEVPILILTINGIHRSKENALSLGANYYMNKPFEEEELIDRIEELVRDH